MQPDAIQSLTRSGDSAHSFLSRPGLAVLVADDHEVVRQGIRRMLEADDHLVVVGEAADGESTIEQIRQLRPDVALIDVRMPGLDGVRHRTAAAGTRPRPARHPDLDLREGRVHLRRLAAGARGYLLKDAGRQDLVRALRAVHDGGSLLQPVIASRLFERRQAHSATGLTMREAEVLRALASGAQDKQIAAALRLSVRTVKFHVRNIYAKLDAHNRTEAVRVANDRGLLDFGQDPPHL